MKISIVIPVYNEAETIGACLDSVALQHDKPYEVIVVDNNSTDNTAAIASSYVFVRLINEKKQGVVHARTTGFNEAKGDIIARIDADSILPKDWTNRISNIFKDKSISAVSGIAEYYDASASIIFNRIDLNLRRWLNHSLKKRMYLWGANMAMRRSDWELVKGEVCTKGGQHEDFDLAIHLNQIGKKVTLDEGMRARVSPRRLTMNYREFMRYTLVCPKTYKRHNINVRAEFYPVIVAIGLLYFPALIAYKGYDSSRQRFSLIKLFTQPLPSVRVDPTTNVF